MKNRKRVFLVGMMMALIGISGCHGSPGDYKVRWVNETDSRKVLELTLQDPPIMARMHMAVFGGRVRGTYVLKDGDKTVEGRVTQTGDAYRLVSTDGKEQRFSVEHQTGSLKDPSGGIWKADNPPTTVFRLKEW